MNRFVVVPWIFIAASVALGACDSNSSPGLTVTFDVVTDDPEHIDANEGPASVTRAYLVTNSIELLPCADGGIAKWFGNPFVSVARAHSVSSPTRLGEPFVEAVDGAAPGAKQRVGVMKPPPGEYCTVRYSVAIADSDAVGLPDDVDMVGRSLWIEGAVAADGEDDVPYEIDSTIAYDVDLAVDPSLFTKGSTVSFVIGKALRSEVQDIDFASMASNKAGRKVLERMRDTVYIEAL